MAMRTLCLIGVLCLTAGCYNYNPLTTPSPEVGTYVAVTLTDPGSEKLARSVGPNAFILRGRYLGDSEQGMFLSVSSVETKQGYRAAVGRGDGRGAGRRGRLDGRAEAFQGSEHPTRGIGRRRTGRDDRRLFAHRQWHGAESRRRPAPEAISSSPRTPRRSSGADPSRASILCTARVARPGCP